LGYGFTCVRNLIESALHTNRHLLQCTFHAYGMTQPELKEYLNQHKRSLVIAISIGSVFLALILVLLSLRLTAARLSPVEQLSYKRFYLARQILPDHIFYSVIQWGKQRSLALLSWDERVLSQAKLSQQRLQEARALVEKGNPALALVSMQKSQALVMEAGAEALEHPVSEQTTASVAGMMVDHLTEVSAIREMLTDQDATQVGQMQAQTEVLLSQLASQAALSN